MEILQARHIEKKYGDFKASDNVDISVPEGSIYGLLGPNGAGKTTLMRIINNIYAPDKGQIFFRGSKMVPSDISKIGYLPEERGLYKKMKVGEQVLYLARLKGLSRTDAFKQAKYWFEKLEIQGWWDKKIEDLSKGMAQKVQFLITVLHKPALLIFDEPFSGIDPINAAMLRDEILELRKNGTIIIFSTHNMSSVEELCDRITLINKSRCILDGNVREIKRNYSTDIFEISFIGDFNLIKENLNSHYQVLDHKITADENFVRLKMLATHKDNMLLSLLIPYVHVTSFSELLPSMNDIFIKVVELSDKKEQ